MAQASLSTGSRSHLLHALGGEVAVTGITHQQALALQVTGNPVSDGLREVSEILAGGRLDPAKPCWRSMDAIDVDSVQKNHMEVDISCEVLRYVE